MTFLKCICNFVVGRKNIFISFRERERKWADFSWRLRNILWEICEKSHKKYRDEK